MKATSTFLIGMILLVPGCASPPEAMFDSAAKEEIRQEVEDRVMGYVQAMKDMDAEYMLDFFADSEGFVFDDYGAPPMGYEEYVGSLPEFIESGASFPRIDVSSMEVVPINLTVASCGLEYSWTMVDGEGNPLNAKGTWTYVMKRFDGAWRVVHSTGMHLYEGPDGVWVPTLDF